MKLLKREEWHMIKMFNQIKSYYDSGFWNEKMVRNAVVKGKITAEEFYTITGNLF